MSAAPSRLPRALHPGAWWLWALSLAIAASRTTNPIVLLLIVAVVGFVVSNRRSEAPWARGFRAYLVLGLVVVAIRVVFRMLLDGQYGQHILFTLPEIPLPAAAAGIRIGGPVSAEGVLAALYDGLRLATLLLCIGAANVLADPKRLLKAMPAALHELGVAITVALSVAPQLVESGQRVRRARRLRGETTRRLHVVKEVAIPVMTDALDRSLLLAAAMDSRGYARSAHVAPGVRRTTGALLVGGLLGVCVGTYGLLDASAPRTLGYPMLAVGVGVAVVGLRLSGRRVVRTRYRQDPWRAAEWVVALSGLVAAVVVLVVATVDPAALYPSFVVVRWPDLPVLPALAVLVGVVPAWVAPPAVRPPRPSPITAGRAPDLALGGAK